MDEQQHPIRDDLRGVIKGDLLFDDLSRVLYSTDASIFQVLPAGVVVPRNEEDVSALVRYAAEHRDEWAAFGARYFRIPRSTMMKSIERELPDLHFDCEVDMEGLAAAIALQQRLGSVPASLRLSDMLDQRFTMSAAQRALAS